MKITSIEYIPIDDDTEEIKFTRAEFFSKSYTCLIGTNRYKRIGKILSAMRRLGKLSFYFDDEIGNTKHTTAYIGYIL